MGMNGTDVLLLANTGTDLSPSYEIVGSQRDVTFDETNSEIDFSNKGSRAFDGAAGRYQAQVTLDALYVPTDAAMLALKTATRDGTNLKIRRQESGVDTEEADCFVTSKSDSFPDQGEATVSITLRIVGEWAAVGS